MKGDQTRVISTEKEKDEKEVKEQEGRRDPRESLKQRWRKEGRGEKVFRLFAAELKRQRKRVVVVSRVQVEVHVQSKGGRAQERKKERKEEWRPW